MMWKPRLSVRPSVWHLMSVTAPFVGFLYNPAQKIYTKSYCPSVSFVKIRSVTVLRHLDS